MSEPEPATTSAAVLRVLLPPVDSEVFDCMRRSQSVDFRVPGREQTLVAAYLSASRRPRRINSALSSPTLGLRLRVVRHRESVLADVNDGRVS
jgi:hypothetical protein